ncbi:MAG: GNAT family N-acetyltransferase [Chloroflexi bacterium]|nr:MAG: GNAT family N-acetyltransferase [Chloroflexota bacterium]
MTEPISIRRVGGGGDALAAGLAGVLIDCVEGGASVGFMLPLDRERAEAFWSGVLDDAARGERIVLVAEERDTGVVVGTVQVALRTPENQPHRGDLAKMLVLRRARRRGLGAALLRAAEAAALDAGKTVLVLDTASADAERLYERERWQRVGTIPRYALWPEGGFSPTVLFYKDLDGR